MAETVKCLVTGGAGFMGSWLVDELLKRGHSVISVDNLSGGYMRNVSKDCKFVKMDLRDKERVFNVTKGVDIIYHLAAYAAEGQSVFSPIEINDINITPINNLLVAAVNNNVRKFVFTSSMAVYGDQTPPFEEKMPVMPEDPYGCGKAYCERMVQIFGDTYGFGYTIIRPHNVYGPRQNITDPYRNVLGIWINRIMGDKVPFIYGDGEQTRAFSYIEDIIPPLANAGFFSKSDKNVINLGSDEVVTVNKACDIVLEVMKSAMKPKHVEPRPCEVKHAHCTVEKSKKLLDYETHHALRDGVKKMVEWAKKIGYQNPTYTVPLEITKYAPEVWKKRLI